MPTEARKTFRQGFVLSEQELRRLVDTAVEQARKALHGDPIVLLRARFRNGTVTECGSVEELLTLENIGPRQIVRLEILVDDGGESTHTEPAVSISVRLANLAEEDDWIGSVAYSIRGGQRDWVLVTASELEDRIERIKCFGAHSFLDGHRSTYRPVMAFVLLLGMFGLFHVISSSSPPLHVKDAVESGQQLDAARAVALLEQDLRERDVFPQLMFLRWVVGFPVIFMVCLYLVVSVARYLHPSYVFAWSDYARVYQRKLSVRNYVYVGIGLTLLVTVVGDMLAAKLGLR
jgi:hypothetical protein